MFVQALQPDTLRGIELLAQIPTIKRAYLAGGSALALHLGHRISEDLDFFTQEEFDEQVLSTELAKFPEFVEEQKAWRTVKGIMGKTKFSLFYYKYTIIDSYVAFEGINLLDKRDIAAMKIHAIEDRGTRRDFLDTYFLAKEFSLEEMLEFYDQKYKCLDERLLTIVKSLAYFDDADNDDWKPQMLVSVDWEKVKKFFYGETLRLARSQLGL